MRLAVTCIVLAAAASPGPSRYPRMSFHNRLLLNRAVVSNVPTIEVMVLASDGELPEARALIEQLGGRIRHVDEDVAYLRADIPTARILTLAESSAIEAWQIASFSRAAWYRDAAPQRNRDMYRWYEGRPLDVPSRALHDDLPVLSVAASREPGYTADEDTGVGEWLTKHPTSDGRGVTIALLESAQACFTDRMFGTVKTLDGRDVPKLAGVINTIDPDDPDETRVTLSTPIDAASTWTRIDGRTYIVPHPGRYHFGIFEVPAGANAVHKFGVLEDDADGAIAVDTNADGSFQDETPIRNVNEQVDARVLTLTYPVVRHVEFVMARGSRPHTVHLYLAINDHQMMTISVAAGSRTADGLAFGVAPGARVLVVRTRASAYRLPDLIEGYLEISKREDVDVLSDSAGFVLVPDTRADFAGQVFRRVIARDGKPMVHGAGNTFLALNSTTVLDGFTAGGSLGSATFRALFGGSNIPGTLVHPLGSAGPSLDGAIKPDFLAPMHRIAANLPEFEERNALPKNAPLARLPPGYRISAGTSSSGPYAAGAIALLLSAARQEHVKYTYDSLARALRIGARFLPGFPSYQQGNGVLDIEGAWRELTRAVEIPRIITSAAIVHPLAQYTGHGNVGEGMYEFEGWSAGMTGRRTMRFRRETGASGPMTYGLAWTGNDGTFATTRSVTLPLREWVDVPIDVKPATSGAHSALLDLTDPASGAIVHRAQATIVAADRADPSTGLLHVGATLPVMRATAHYFSVPQDIDTLRLDLHVINGSVRPLIVPMNGLNPFYYEHLLPDAGLLIPGTYTLAIPHPAQGVWSVALFNDSAYLERDRARTSVTDAQYELTIRLLHASIHAQRGDANHIEVSAENLAGGVDDPTLEVSQGTLRAHDERLLASGLPTLIPIDVPDGASTLVLRLRSHGQAEDGLELHLYDCTSGECFADSLPLPAAAERTLVVRRPTRGRWVAAVNAAPFAGRPGRFALDEIVVTGPPRRLDTTSSLRHGGRTTWTIEPGAPPRDREGTPVWLLELLDRAIERDETNHPWRNAGGKPPLRDRPVAIGTAIYRSN